MLSNKMLQSNKMPDPQTPSEHRSKRQQPGAPVRSMTLARTDGRTPKTGNNLNKKLAQVLLLEEKTAQVAQVAQVAQEQHLQEKMAQQQSQQATLTQLVESSSAPLHVDKPDSNTVKNDPNCHATIILPSFNLEIENQHAPSSLLWYVFARASPNLAGRFALLGKEQDEVRSIPQLRELLKDVPNFLNLPRDNDDDDAGRREPRRGPLPFSLVMITHGKPGKVVIGGNCIPVLDLVQLIVKCLPEAIRPLLRHVHIDACETLQGVTEADVRRRRDIQHISLSGFNVEVPVAPAQWLGQRFMVALSEVLQKKEASDVEFSVLLHRAKTMLQQQPDLRNPPRVKHGQEMTVPQLLEALTIV
tara:strand:- start:296 stop:1372 length:1077 start_codon:yes stop_codon:yes gene_type:complete